MLFLRCYYLFIVTCSWQEQGIVHASLARLHPHVEDMHGVSLEHEHLIICKILLGASGVSACTAVGRNDFPLCSFIHP